MGPSLPVLLLGCFQFVQEHRLWTAALEQAVCSLGCGKHQERELCLWPQWTGPVWWRVIWGDRWGHMCFHFLLCAEKQGKPICRERMKNKKKWREEQRGGRVRARVAALIPDGSQSRALILAEAQLQPPALGSQGKSLSVFIRHMYGVEPILNIWTSLSGFLFLVVQEALVWIELWPLKSICWSSNPQCDCIWRSGLQRGN